MAKIDKTLKETLHCEDTKDEILEKYEQIMLDEHFTNLYAPRKLISKYIKHNNHKNY